MIRSLHIERLRGIAAGRLDDLARLTVLVGPNAAGKSTILDALLMAVSPIPEEAIGWAVQRRTAVPRGARWLFHKSSLELQRRLEAQGAWQVMQRLRDLA